MGTGGMRNTVHLILYTDKQHIRIRIGAIYLGEITERSKEKALFLFLKIIFFFLLNFQQQILLKILNISHTVIQNITTQVCNYII